MFSCTKTALNTFSILLPLGFSQMDVTLTNLKILFSLAIIALQATDS